MKKAKNDAALDPYADREAANYENPIPSREFILQVLAEVGQPIKRKHIAALLNITDEEGKDALRRRLRAMERDGQVICNRRSGYGLIDKMDLICGMVTAHPDGFGFLITEDGSEDLFINARQMRAVFHGDRILVNVTGIDRRGRREAAVVEVLQRNTQRVVGRYWNHDGIGVLRAENPRITHDIIIADKHRGEAIHGQIVVVEIIQQPEAKKQPMGRVVEILGEHMAPGMEIDIAIRKHELPYQWPHALEKEIKDFREHINPADIEGREDLRHLPFVTIDGADARDFDDAVYCEKKGQSWRLWVAIADVAHYVKRGSALDQEALLRGNSVYFPAQVIPMLPEILSNGLCSLNPHVDRLAMVCEMTITGKGNITKYRFFNAVFQSYARLIYDDVAAALQAHHSNNAKAIPAPIQERMPQLLHLEQLFQVLFEARIKRGAIEFHSTETVIRFDDQRKIAAIEPLQRNDAHRLIEECMIAANICAARFIDEHQQPALYRIHEPPKAEKLQDLRSFLSELGLQLGGGNKPQPRHYAQLLESVQQRNDMQLIQTVMLRSLNQAIYHPENQGHFGLALTHYTHFTSPIRRYPDLLVHRVIKSVLNGSSAKRSLYSENDAVSIGEQCSHTERRADEATRDVVDWLKCEYMMDKVGEEYAGIITGVTSFGLFVELQGIYVEGLVHVTSLNNDYYHFDPIKHCLIGDRTRQRYRLGDALNVVVARVDLDEKQIDFTLTNNDSDGIPARATKRAGKSTKAANAQKRRDVGAKGAKGAKGSKGVKAKGAKPVTAARDSKSKKGKKGKRR